MIQSLSYKDVILSPRYSEIVSRDDINTQINFCGKKFKSPILPSNMACCINFKNAELLATQGYFYILHRFYDYNNEILPWIKKNNRKFLLSISIGVKSHDYNFLKILSDEINLQIDFITIDVAHGHHVSVKNICEYFDKLK